jgi:hypothetical protein
LKSSFLLQSGKKQWYAFSVANFEISLWVITEWLGFVASVHQTNARPHPITQNATIAGRLCEREDHFEDCLKAESGQSLATKPIAFMQEEMS